MARIVVIGAGMGGMASAARLRVKGHDVTLVEAAPGHGGRVGALHHEGFTFDTGPSVFTLPAVYRDLFLKTGTALEDSVELVELEPGFEHRFGTTSLTLPGAGVGRCAVAVGEALGARSEDEWRALMAHAAEVWSHLRRGVLEVPVAGPRDLTELARDRSARRALAPWQSLRQLGRRHLSDPRARQLLDHYALGAGSDPRRTPGTQVLAPYIEATFGLWHIGGGVHRLADALRARLDERRVTVRMGTRATRIMVTGGKVSAVEVTPSEATSGRHSEPRELLPADVVVATAHAGQVYGALLGPQTPRLAARRLRASRPGLSTFSLHLAVRGRTPDLRHHTVWHGEDPDLQVRTLFARHPQPPSDPTIHACVPDDPAQCPPGHEAWTLQVSVPRHGQGRPGPGTFDWSASGVATNYADLLLDRLAQRGTDLRERVLWRAIRTPADIEHDTTAPGGSSYGVVPTTPRAVLGRASNASPLPGLFLVGDSAHPGSGLPLVGLGAEIVADLIGRA